MNQEKGKEEANKKQYIYKPVPEIQQQENK